MSKLRLGRHNKQLVYVQDGDDASNDDRLFGVFFDAADASKVVGWENFLRGLCNIGTEPGRIDHAVEYWTAKLANLDRIIADDIESPFPGVRNAAELLQIQRRHLAALLWAFGVESPEVTE